VREESAFFLENEARKIPEGSEGIRRNSGEEALFQENETERIGEERISEGEALFQ
jgi:hypothetical protein